MAVPLIINGVTFQYPVDFDTNWGVNATGWAQAVTSGMLQKAGGSFPLTAEVDFGSSFGLKSLYYKSRSAGIATTGALRLGATDEISFSASNYPLSTDGSGNLTWRGDIIATSTGDVTSIIGTTNQVIASSPTGNVTLSLPQSIATSSTPTFASETLSATTNQLILGTTNTTTLSATAPAASRVYTIPDAGAPANVLLDKGNYTLTGTWTNATFITPALGTPTAGVLSSCTGLPLTTGVTGILPIANGGTNSSTALANGRLIQSSSGALVESGILIASNSITLPSSKAVIFTDNTVNTITLKATDGTTSYTLSVPPNSGTNGFFLQTDGSGNTTWASGGSGTVSAGTATHLAYYATSTNTISDANGASINGSYTYTGGAGAITMSGSTIAMGANKITGLADGSASTDATAFGQVLGFRVLQITSGTTTTSTSSASNTFVDTALTGTITPTLATSKVFIMATTDCFKSTSDKMYVTIARGGTNLAPSTTGFQAVNFGGGADDCSSIMFLDSPASTSALTYTVRIRSDSAGNANFNLNGANLYIYMFEIG